MNCKVLYLGDTSLSSAASYLAGVMAYHEIAFDYVASDVAFGAARLSGDYAAVIISDYPSNRFTAAEMQQLTMQVRQGMGLLMIGGWESFTGLSGNYCDTPLAEILPVAMQPTDDRINSYSPCLIQPETQHEITRGLPFAEHAAAINGYNQWQARTGAATLLSLQRYATTFRDGEFCFDRLSHDPLLVVDRAEAGRVACYAGDCAPHWAGGFVDWGDKRHLLRAAGAEEVEIGNWYLEFFGNLVKWVAGKL